MNKYMFFICMAILSSALRAEDLPDPRSYIKPDALDQIIEKAKMGSGDHSYWLSTYYIDALSDAHEGEFWLRLSAEQGSCQGKTEYLRFVEHLYKKNITDLSKEAGSRILKIECRLGVGSVRTETSTASPSR